MQHKLPNAHAGWCVADAAWHGCVRQCKLSDGDAEQRKRTARRGGRDNGGRAPAGMRLGTQRVVFYLCILLRDRRDPAELIRQVLHLRPLREQREPAIAEVRRGVVSRHRVRAAPALSAAHGKKKRGVFQLIMGARAFCGRPLLHACSPLRSDRSHFFTHQVEMFKQW
jgi:hypothetical protein